MKIQKRLLPYQHGATESIFFDISLPLVPIKVRKHTYLVANIFSCGSVEKLNLFRAYPASFSFVSFF